MLFDKIFLKFIFVGIFNTLFSYFIFAFLLHIGVPYPFSAFIATVLSVLFSFKTQGTLVFQNSNKNLFLKFICLYSIIYCINVMILKLANLLNYDLYFVGFGVTCLSAILSFCGSRYWVFKK